MRCLHKLYKHKRADSDYNNASSAFCNWAKFLTGANTVLVNQEKLC